MDAYSDYVEHNLPLVFLSGLGERGLSAQAAIALPKVNGIRIKTASEQCQGDRAAQLLDQFLHQDGSEESWNAQSLPGPAGTLKYRVQPIGRVGMPRRT